MRIEGRPQLRLVGGRDVGNASSPPPDRHRDDLDALAYAVVARELRKGYGRAFALRLVGSSLIGLGMRMCIEAGQAEGATYRQAAEIVAARCRRFADIITGKLN